MRVNWLAAVAALGMAVVSSATAVQAQNAADAVHWDYVGKYGPINWGKLDPSFKACGNGKEQSPVDLRGAKRNKALQPIEFHYISGPVEVVNDGHTIHVNVAPGSYIVSDGVRYDLTEFNFHHPGEEAIKGRLSDVSVHFVHKSADGKYAVIAVLLNEDINTPNALISTLWTNLPKAAGQTEKISDSLNAGGLLPGSRAYWTYTGSLTVPPCTEGVKWFVMQQPLTIGRGQLKILATMFPISSRPLQDLHGRKIEASE